MSSIALHTLGSRTFKIPLLDDISQERRILCALCVYQVALMFASRIARKPQITRECSPTALFVCLFPSVDDLLG